MLMGFSILSRTKASQLIFRSVRKCAPKAIIPLIFRNPPREQVRNYLLEVTTSAVIETIKHLHQIQANNWLKTYRNRKAKKTYWPLKIKTQCN